MKRHADPPGELKYLRRSKRITSLTVACTLRSDGVEPPREDPARIRVVFATARTFVFEPHDAIGMMRLALCLGFRAVAVVACDDEIEPLVERLVTVADHADLDEMYATERNLLYVACTRARDRLLVTSTVPASEFLDDLLL